MDSLRRFPSISQIATRSAVGIFLFTVGIGLVVSVSVLVNDFQGQFQAEARRLELLAPVLARTLYGEILSGDDQTLEAVRINVARANSLDSLEIQNLSAPDCVSTGLGQQVFSRYWELCSSYVIDGVNPPKRLVLRARHQRELTWALLLNLSWALTPLLVFGTFYTLRLRRKLRVAIVRPLASLSESPETWVLGTAESKTGQQYVAREVVELASKFRSYLQEHDRQKELTNSLQLKASLGEFAAGVAHDMKSPLAALQLLMKRSHAVPEEYRSLLENSVARIQDISRELLEKYRGSPEANTSPRIPCHLLTLIESIVAEKRFTSSGRSGLQIETDWHPEDYGAFCNVSKSDFYRILSNLLNNAIEAIDDQGKIHLSLSYRTGFAKIAIRDTGRGMSEEILKQVMSQGKSFHKEGGTGIGIASARQKLKDWGGTLSIQSELGKGTTVELEIPTVSPPDWFASSLTLPASGRLLIVDDDESILQLWRERLKQTAVELQYFRSPEELIESFRKESHPDTELLALIDHRFGNSTWSGLDLIKNLKWQDRATLVTTYADEPDLQQKALQAGVRVIPKLFVPLIPLAPPRSIEA